MVSWKISMVMLNKNLNLYVRNNKAVLMLSALSNICKKLL
jgi:hypothetical protein